MLHPYIGTNQLIRDIVLQQQVGIFMCDRRAEPHSSGRGADDITTMVPAADAAQSLSYHDVSDT